MAKKSKKVLPINSPLDDIYFDKLEKINNQYENWFNSQKFKYESKGGKIIVNLEAI